MTPNLSSRLGQWNSKDTRSRLRSVAEKRLRANSLGPKISTPSSSIKSTTVVQSRGEEGLLTEGSEPELTQIRTQTSRSIVMRRSRIKQQKEGSPYFKHFYVIDFKSLKMVLLNSHCYAITIFQISKDFITRQSPTNQVWRLGLSQRLQQLFDELQSCSTLSQQDGLVEGLLQS